MVIAGLRICGTALIALWAFICLPVQAVADDVVTDVAGKAALEKTCISMPSPVLASRPLEVGNDFTEIPTIRLSAKQLAAQKGEACALALPVEDSDPPGGGPVPTPGPDDQDDPGPGGGESTSSTSCIGNSYQSKLTLKKRISIKRLLARRKGLPVTAWSNLPSTARISVDIVSATISTTVFGPRKAAKKKGVPILTRYVKLTAGINSNFKLTPKKHVIRKLKRAIKRSSSSWGRYLRLRITMVAGPTDTSQRSKNGKIIRLRTRQHMFAKVKGRGALKGKPKTYSRKTKARSLCDIIFYATVKAAKRSFKKKTIKISKLLGRKGKRGRGIRARVFCNLSCRGRVGLYLYSAYGKKLKISRNKKGKPRPISRSGRVTLQAGKVRSVRLKGPRSKKIRRLIRKALSSRRGKKVTAKLVFVAKTMPSPRIGRRAKYMKRVWLR